MTSSRALAFGLMALVAVIFAAACHRPGAPPSGLARVKAAGVLRWGGDRQGGEPYVYSDPAHPERLIGFEVELADALARQLGVRAEFVQNDWSTLVPSLERKTFDIAMNGLEITEARKARVLFSRPYYIFAERLVARRGDLSILPSLDALSGKKVGTLAQSLGFELLRGRSDVVVYEGVEEPYIDLATGRTDAVLLDDIIAARYGTSKPELRAVGDISEGAYAIACARAEPDLARAVDEALAAVIARGELREILERYGLWSARQAKLGEARGEVAGVGDSNVRRSMNAGQLMLFVRGAGVTLLVSSLAMALAAPLGLLLALARLYGGRWAARVAAAYVEALRGTPVLLQLYLLYYGLAPVLRLGPLTAAVVGLGLNYAAYEAEVYRAGLLAVPKAQLEAALALGMSMRLALRRVGLPQALRHAVPNVTNDFISLLKDSSLVSVITVVELTKQMTITAVDVRSWLGPGLLCAFMYFAMSFPLGRVARRLERRLDGERRAASEATS